MTFEYPRYDKVGNRLRMKVDAEPKQVYEYDALYQLTYVDYNDGMTVRYDYDDLGNRDDVNVSGTHTAYLHNRMNQYMQVASVNFSWDDNGNLTDDGYTSYTYDYENRLLSSTCDTLNPAHLGPDLVRNGTFTESASGWTLGSGGGGGWTYEDNHVQFASYETAADLEQSLDDLEAGATYRITYDVLYVYTPYGTSSVGIELGGASTDNVTLSTGSQTRYVTTSNDTGNLKFKGATTGLIEIDFDNITVELIPDANVQYAYDYKGRRVKKTVTAAYGTASSTTTTFTYDDDQVIAEYDNEGALLRKFVYGPGIDEPVCMIDVTDNNAVYYYFFDGLGSVAMLTDAVGNTVETYTYDIFGEPIIKGPSDEYRATSDYNNPYLFTGRRYDHESATYYYRARQYDPVIGRFMQVDPHLYVDGLDLYSYVVNNPIVFTDPGGKRLMYCYTDTAFGIPFFHHGYLWYDGDREMGKGEGVSCGQTGSSGLDLLGFLKPKRPGTPYPDNDQAGPDGRDGRKPGHCTEIAVRDYRQARCIMEMCRQSINNGLYIPLINDCHNSVKDVVKRCGASMKDAFGNDIRQPRIHLF